MVQLVRQRRQRPAHRPAEHDLPDEVTRQRLGQHDARYSQLFGRRLTRTGQAGVIQDSQLCGNPRLQCLQKRPLPGECNARRRAEDLADNHRQLLSPLIIRWGQLRHRELDGGRSRPGQRTLLITAQHQRGQLLAASIGQ
jgi:hypothetical protein